MPEPAIDPRTATKMLGKLTSILRRRLKKLRKNASKNSPHLADYDRILFELKQLKRILEKNEITSDHMDALAHIIDKMNR
jgi:transcription initiation factor TFIIIB Brf1 subunit/transcription initiation factor TFIIB